MSSHVDTAAAGEQAGEQVGEHGAARRPPPPGHRSPPTALLDSPGAFLDTPTTVLPTPAGAPTPTVGTPAAPGADDGPTAVLDGARHRAALLAATLAPDEEPPFLQEPTVAVPTTPPPPLAERISELAYQRRAVAALVLAALVLVAAVLVTRGPDDTEADGPPSSLADGGAALMGPVRVALAAFGSSTRVVPAGPSGAAGSAGAEGETTTTAPEATSVPDTEPAPETTTPTTSAPAPTGPPATTPGTVQPRFCTVWVDGPVSVLAQPDDNADPLGQIGVGLYWVSAVTEDRPRWYLIDNGSVRGWVPDDDVDRQGDCRGRR